MGVPDRIIEKTPTAGLWPGQTDENELGLSYETADQVLTLLVDEKRNISEIKRKFPPEMVDKLAARIFSSGHKRMPPCVIEIGFS
jgi:NAD+ synthase